VHTARAELDEEQDMDRFEEARLDGEEIAGQQLILVRPDAVAPGCRPSALWNGRDAVPPEGGAHGRGADGVAERAQLALDAPMAPPGVLPRQPQDQRVHLGGESGATAPIRPAVGPRAPDQLAMPFQDRVRLEEEQVLVELVPRADGKPGERGGQDGQDQPLPAREAGRAGALALQQAHLLPQHHDLEILVTTALPRAADHVDEERHEMCEYEPEHPPLLIAPHLSAAQRAAPRTIMADREEGLGRTGKAVVRAPTRYSHLTRMRHRQRPRPEACTERVTQPGTDRQKPMTATAKGSQRCPPHCRRARAARMQGDPPHRRLPAREVSPLPEAAFSPRMDNEP